MKLEHQIVKSLLEHPALYRCHDFATSRLRVLNQLFVVNGNGCCWYDGYITDECTETDWADEQGWVGVRGPKYGAHKFTRRLPKNFFTKYIPWMSTNEGKTTCLGDSRAYHQGVYVPYPPCSLMELAHIPDNVRPDWLRGAKEICAAALHFYRTPALYREYDTYFRHGRNNKKWLGSYVKKSIRLLQAAQTRINSLE